MPQHCLPDLSELEAGLLRLIAPNASAMTHWGTNTYILGTERCVVIDPGPRDMVHLKALLGAINGRDVTHILVTHSHVDHSSLARDLAAELGAPVCAYGRSGAGRSSIMQRFARADNIGGGEGVDADFSPDQLLKDGEILTTGAGAIEVIHTPGHFGNHVCFSWEGRLFSGDHVMEWSSSVVLPPDGDMGDFMASCEKLLMRDEEVYFPGHGREILEGKTRVRTLIARRQGREAKIVGMLKEGGASARALSRDIYRELAPELLAVAERTVLAHLVDLTKRGLVFAEPDLTSKACFYLCEGGEGGSKKMR